MPGKCQRRFAGCRHALVSSVPGNRYDPTGIGQRGGRCGYRLISRRRANDHGEAAKVEIEQGYPLTDDGKRFLTIDPGYGASSRPGGKLK
jgi:hypothetical protein